jgi:hypothetical protein
LLIAALVLVAVPFTAAGSGAQEEPDVIMAVRKVVVGTGTGPSAVTIDCETTGDIEAADAAVLHFDAQGNPTTASEGVFQIIDGAWVAFLHAGNGAQCTFTETTTGGASSTSWTCDYGFDPLPQAFQAEEGGCLAAAGTGVGPATVAYQSGEGLRQQDSTVVFTNTFETAPLQPLQPLQPAPQVTARPTFTG